MRINDSCAECLYDKQQHLTDDKEYLNRVKEIIDSFLCKCDLFTNRFGVPKLTGIFVEEQE